MSKKSNYPEVRIQDGWLLRVNVSTQLHKLNGKKGDKLADDKEMKKIVSAYKKAWAPYEKKIMQGMCELYDLQFKQNTIDVFIAPWFSAFSNPMVIGVKYTPDEFIDTLTHEMLHRLLTDNTSNEVKIQEWQKLFRGVSGFSALVHIPVHAALKAIYLDVLKDPSRLKRDIESCKKYDWGGPYSEAWEYVEKHGYKEINRKLRELYKKNNR